MTIGNSIKEMLEIDKKEEEEAIELNTHIIEVANKEQDDITMMLFQRILLDEERHHSLPVCRPKDVIQQIRSNAEGIEEFIPSLPRVFCFFTGSSFQCLRR